MHNRGEDKIISAFQNYRRTIATGTISRARDNSLGVQRQPLIFSVPLRDQGRKRAQIYSPPVPPETLHFVHHLLRFPRAPASPPTTVFIDPLYIYLLCRGPLCDGGRAGAKGVPG